MKRVDFYVLGQDGPDVDMRFACRLTQQVYTRGQRVHLHVDDIDQAQRLDGLLWTFQDGSFVPHEVLGLSDDAAPVTIGAAVNLPDEADVLVNLASELPAAADRFDRIAEIVTANPIQRNRSRERYRQYKARGYTIETHTLDS
ncbi:MAG: DNA polymerase III subunit chi [Pseudomonadota bacterium]